MKSLDKKQMKSNPMALNDRLQRRASSASQIDAFMREVHKVHQNLRWIYVYEDVSAAFALKKPIVLGERSRIVKTMLRHTARLGLALPIVCLLSFLALGRLLVSNWLFQRRRSVCGHGPWSKIFFSTGALREGAARSDLDRHTSGNVLVIDQRFPSEASWGFIISPVHAWNQWRVSLHAIVSAYRRGELVGFTNDQFLLNLLKLLHLKAYFSAALITLRKNRRLIKGDVTIACVTPFIPAFAAVDHGFKTVFYQHGLLSRSLAYPNLNDVVNIDVPESLHLRSLIPSARFWIYETTFGAINTNATIAIAGVRSKVREQEHISAFVEVCRRSGVQVVIRPHPEDATGSWNEWRGVEGIRFDSQGDFFSFLQRTRPRILMSRSSTTLIDALAMGAMPVNISAVADDLLFPIEEIALCWPDDMETVTRILNQLDLRTKMIMERRALVFGDCIGRPIKKHAFSEAAEAVSQVYRGDSFPPC